MRARREDHAITPLSAGKCHCDCHDVSPHMPPAASRRKCAVSGPDRFKISELAVSFDAVELAPLAAPGPCS